jgi:hypothetical protein
MAEISHTSPAPQPLSEDPTANNATPAVIWTIGCGDKSEIPALPRIPPAKQVSSTVINQSSTGVFELQEPVGFINQREDPSNVRARIAYSVLMVLTGLGLAAVGVFCEFRGETPGGGVPFWVIGALLLFPGLYCAWDSVHTYQQLQMTERQQIFKEEEPAI